MCNTRPQTLILTDISDHMNLNWPSTPAHKLCLSLCVSHTHQNYFTHYNKSLVVCCPDSDLLEIKGKQLHLLSNRCTDMSTKSKHHSGNTHPWLKGGEHEAFLVLPPLLSLSYSNIHSKFDMVLDMWNLPTLTLWLKSAKTSPAKKSRKCGGLDVSDSGWQLFAKSDEELKS